MPRRLIRWQGTTVPRIFWTCGASLATLATQRQMYCHSHPSCIDPKHWQAQRHFAHLLWYKSSAFQLMIHESDRRLGRLHIRRLPWGILRRSKGLLDLRQVNLVSRYQEFHDYRWVIFRFTAPCWHLKTRTGSQTGRNQGEGAARGASETNNPCAYVMNWKKASKLIGSRSGRGVTEC